MTKELLNYFAGDELAASTWENKYALRDDRGELVETSPEEMHHRLAKEFWRVEKDFIDKAIIDKNKLSEYGQRRKDLSEETIFKLFDKFKYIVPAGSVMAGAGGNKPVSLSNCFVLPTMPKDSYSSIMFSRQEMVQLEKRRGGTGVDLSNLRPRGAFVNNAAKTSTGAASFMEGFSAINNEVAQCIEENQEVLTKKGLVKIKDINIGDEVYTRKGFIKVIGKFDKGIRDTIILKTKQGTELKATSDHVIMSADNTIGPINKKISDLNIGDPIGILLGQNNRTEYQSLIHSYQKPLSRTLKDGEKIPHNRYEEIILPTALNEKLAYLIGYAHGDGYTEVRKQGTSSLSVTVCSADTEIINKIISYRQEVFGKEVNSYPGCGNCVKIHICATEGCEFLKENGLDKPKTENLKVPNKIWSSPSSVQMAYLSGLFDADGYASGRKKGYAYCTINEQFSKDIRKLLNLNGIFSKCHVEVPKNKKWSTKYNICIVGKYNQNLFLQKTTESIKVQSKKFVSKRDCIISPFIIGNEGIKKQSHIQYKTLLSCASLNKAGYQDGMIALDYVTEISSGGKNHVYDIELESENMFWCEGVYVHNCGRRGALMITLSIAHPDSPEFIMIKQDPTKVTGANVSVKIPDDFMKAVEKNEDYLLHWPVQADHVPILEVEMEYNILYPSQYVNSTGTTGRGYIKKVKAKELWDSLIHCAWNTAEPGILFESTLHDYAPDGVYPKFKMISTNPCGEIPMGNGDSCRLIHVNLPSFVNNPFQSNANIDYDKLYSVFYETTRLGDDLVTLEEEAVGRILDIVNVNDPEYTVWNKIQTTAREGRRSGIGFFGLSDMIAKLGLKFCSPESIEVVDKVCHKMMEAELDAEVDLAIERGMFPSWNKTYETADANKWYKFISSEYPEQWERMQKHGRRNISFSTVAPTGTVAMVARASSGIEPVFMPFYMRRRKCNSEFERVDFTDKMGIKFQEFIVVHPGLEEWAKITYPEDVVKNWKLDKWQEVFEKSPWYGSTSPEIDWEKRVELQGVVQKYITHAISSTVNLPNDVTEDEVSKIYMTAWKTGNKGQTIYRDGSRDGILVKAEEKRRDDKFRSYVEAPKRPKVLPADFYTTKVKGELFYVMVGLYLDKPYEIFVFKPDLAENEKPPKQHRGEITKIKRGVYTFKSDLFTIENISKDLSPIEYTVVLFSSMLLRTGANIKYVIKTAQKAKDGINGFTSALVRILSKYSPDELLKGETCPECGGTLVRESGCIMCKDCGYSKCL